MTNGNGAPQEQSPPQLNVLAQYTKDLSFENPNAPASLAPQQQQPAINIQIRCRNFVIARLSSWRGQKLAEPSNLRASLMASLGRMRRRGD